MSEGRCPDCGALHLPGTMHCPGCGRFRYRWLTRVLVLLIIAAAAYALRRYGLLTR